MVRPVCNVLLPFVFENRAVRFVEVYCRKTGDGFKDGLTDRHPR